MSLVQGAHQQTSQPAAARATLLAWPEFNKPVVWLVAAILLIMPFIVNSILLWLTDKLLGSFEIETMGGLLFSAGAITFVNAIFYMLINAHRVGLYSPGPTRWI